MKLRSLTPLMLGLSVPLSGTAQFLNMDTFQQTGAREATLSGASATGASLTYDDNSVSGRNDTGMVAPINNGSLRPFTQVGDTMTYRFRLSGISTANTLYTPVYRVGFDFGSTAALRYETSVGTQDQLVFGSNTNGNPFSTGSTTALDEDNWSPFDLRDIRFNSGNEIDATVSLELIGITGANAYDYLMTVTYVSILNASDTNTLSHAFTDVNGNEVQSLFHVTNSNGMVQTDAYTISNASLQFTAIPEPSSFAFISGLLFVTMAVLRRRLIK